MPQRICTTPVKYGVLAMVSHRTIGSLSLGLSIPPMIGVCLKGCNYGDGSLAYCRKRNSGCWSRGDWDGNNPNHKLISKDQRRIMRRLYILILFPLPETPAHH